MRELGKSFNVIPVATGLHISLKNASGVTFVCYEDAGTQSITFKESIAGASEQNLTTINDYYSSSGVGSTWSHDTADNDATLDDDYVLAKKDTTAFDCAAIYIGADELSDGFDSVECTIDGAGLCIAIVHLLVERDPVNLGTSAV